MKLVTAIHIALSLSLQTDGSVVCNERLRSHQFCIDVCHPCSGSLIEGFGLPLVQQNLRNTLNNLRSSVWELTEHLNNSKREYERTIFGDDISLINQIETAEDLTISTEVTGSCEITRAHLRLVELLTETSLLMKPLHTGYAIQKSLTIGWSDNTLQNVLCYLQFLPTVNSEDNVYIPCSYIVKFRRLGTGKRKMFALWMLNRIQTAVALIPEIESAYSVIRNQALVYL
ncbi:uncharacterized protein LOC133181353 [Saccostrea echinata]|uniref:uncharacterized protein LOC133181353 n=1 Tax=Saccostrea echinata TaxID=191078 RepID=UPI002A80F9F6|nr:uncharacterized protein LOC133181353 [Saccostrea echinata]